MLNPEFLITSLIVVLIPGTGVIYTLSTGLFRGWRESLSAALGCTLGIVPHLTTCILGLSVILHMSAVAFQVLKTAGAAYLLYLAWAMWKNTGALKIDNSVKNHSLLKIAIRGVVINILNPKLTLFFLTFLPQFLSADPEISPMAELFYLSSIFMGMTFFVFAAYGLLANAVRVSFVKSSQRIKWAQRFFAAAFASFAIKLAATR